MVQPADPEFESGTVRDKNITDEEGNWMPLREIKFSRRN